ncbi:MAG TPA: DUF4384 domain-containing protein [Desulfomonilaceae bacterium]|nr:DUF4384 domain-containing protein [Desulfomonilaceae bacterium]
MKASSWKMIGVLVLFTVGTLWSSVVAFAGSEGNSDPRQVWMSLGEKGPNAIGLKVWTQKKQGEAFSEGEPIILNFETSRKAYVMAVNVSPKGDVMVLFPNGESPDNLILPGKTYTLFGPDSSIQVTAGEKIKEAVIIFYAALKPFKLDPLKAPEGHPVIRIPHSDTAQLGVLTTKLHDLSQDEGFNRQAVVLKSAGSGGIALELMAPRSSKPGGVTGGQGLKPEDEKLGKE